MKLSHTSQPAKYRYNWRLGATSLLRCPDENAILKDVEEQILNFIHEGILQLWLYFFTNAIKTVTWQ